MGRGGIRDRPAASFGFDELARSARGLEGSSDLVSIYIATLGPGSRVSIRSALEKIASVASGGRADALLFPWAALRGTHIMTLRAALAETLAPRTVNRHLSAVRGVLREAWRLGAIDTESYEAAVGVPGLPVTRVAACGGSLVNERRLFENCAHDARPARGARDAALLAVLIGAGLRRGELVALDLDDVELNQGALRVPGRRGAGRVVYLGDSAVNALALWLRHRGPEPGSLFCRVLRGGHVRLARLSPQTVRLVLARRIRESGLEYATPEDFRRAVVRT